VEYVRESCKLNTKELAKVVKVDPVSSGSSAVSLRFVFVALENGKAFHSVYYLDMIRVSGE
jgi:hypothetical protein